MRAGVPLLGLASIALCCAFAHAEPAELAFMPKVGLETRHRLIVSGQLDVTTGEGKPSYRAGEATGRIEFTRKVLSQTEDQTVVETRQTKGEFAATEEGQQGKIKLAPLTLVTTYDRRRVSADTGPPITAESPEPDEEGFGCSVVGQMHVGCGMWTELLRTLVLPTGPVSPGAAWEKTEDGTSNTMVNYRFEGVAERAGRRCAKIRATWQHEYSLADMMKLSRDTAHPETEQFMLYQVGDAGDVTWYYDLDSAVEVYLEGVVRRISEQPGVSATWTSVENVKLVLLE